MLDVVGILRAKSDLIITWNSGGQGDATSLAMTELMGGWEVMEKVL